MFSQPPIASVGLNQRDAETKYGTLDIYESVQSHEKHPFRRGEKTYMKLIVEQKTQIVRGVHMVGFDSAEIMQAMAIALKLEATKADFDSVIGIHPTAAEEFVTMRQNRTEIHAKHFAKYTEIGILRQV